MRIQIGLTRAPVLVALSLATAALVTAGAAAHLSAYSDDRRAATTTRETESDQVSASDEVAPVVIITLTADGIVPGEVRVPAAPAAVQFLVRNRTGLADDELEVTIAREHPGASGAPGRVDSFKLKRARSIARPIRVPRGEYTVGVTGYPEYELRVIAE